MKSNFRVEGFKELEAALKELPKNIGRGVSRRAIKKAGDDMAQAQKGLAPVDDGSLRDSITVRVSTRNLDGLAEYGAARRAGAGAREAARAMRAARRMAKATGDHKGHRIAAQVGPTQPHAHLAEFGTVQRFHKSGKSTGVMPAQPYIRPAFDHGLGRAVGTIRSGLIEEVNAAVARRARKRARQAAKEAAGE